MAPQEWMGSGAEELGGGQEVGSLDFKCLTKAFGPESKGRRVLCVILLG